MTSEQFAIAPLEDIRAPPGLDGRDGTRRLPGLCTIPAETDLEAVRYWVEATSQNANTERARRSAAEKLLNWAYLVRKTALSSFEPADFGAFLDFAVAPSPPAIWVGARAARRDAPEWRPFCGWLGSRSIANLSANLQSMIAFLAASKFARLNFASGKRCAREGLADSSFAFQVEPGWNSTLPMPKSEWAWVLEWLMKENLSGDGAELLLVVGLLYYGELRLNELSSLSTSDLVPPRPDDQRWHLMRHDRNGELYSIEPLPDVLYEALKRITGGRVGIRVPKAPVLWLGPQDVAKVVKRVFDAAAALAERSGDVPNAEGLRSRTAMSLRHARASHWTDQATLDYLSSVVWRS